MRLLPSLLCFASLLAHIHSEDELFGIVGETFTFPVAIKQRIVEIIWKKNKDKVAEWDGQNTPTYFTPLRNRSMLKEDGCLTIFKLEKSDAGTYELHYWDSLNDRYLEFVLAVLDPPSEPKISCDIRGDNLVLNCTSDFQRPLNYTWTLSNDPDNHQGQEYSIPIENVDATKKATCVIAFSQTEKSSEISLIECISDKKGHISQERHRYILIVACVLFVLSLAGLVIRCVRGRNKRERGRLAQSNSPVHGSGEREQLVSGNSQEQHNSDRVTFSQLVHCENENPEADRELNKEDSAPKDDQAVNDGVNQEEHSAMQNGTRTSKSAVDHGVTEEEATQGAEGGNGEHLNNSSSCSKEDLKS